MTPPVPGGAACYKSGTTTQKIGSVTRGPTVTEDGVLVSYTQNNPDSEECPEIIITVVMICTPHKVGVYCLDCVALSLFLDIHSCSLVIFDP